MASPDRTRRHGLQALAALGAVPLRVVVTESACVKGVRQALKLV